MLRPDLPCLIAARADMVPASVAVPSDVSRVPCHGCGTVLLLAPCSVRLVAEGRAQPACLACEQAHQGGLTVAVALPPGAGEDVRRWELEKWTRPSAN